MTAYVAPAATHIFGVFYAKGAPVDVSAWSDRAIQEALDRGWITPSSGSTSRTTVAVTSSSLADGASQQTSVTMAKGFRLIHLQTDKAARVEVYTNAANQTADASRAIGTDPAAGAGVILDYVTTGAQSVDLSPMPDGHNTESTPNTTVPVTITNKSGSTGTVTVTFTWQQTEG